jgi:hypothetical protein
MITAGATLLRLQRNMFLYNLGTFLLLNLSKSMPNNARFRRVIHFKFRAENSSCHAFQLQLLRCQLIAAASASLLRRFTGDHDHLSTNCGQNSKHTTV